MSCQWEVINSVTNMFNLLVKALIAPTGFWAQSEVGSLSIMREEEGRVRVRFQIETRILSSILDTHQTCCWNVEWPSFSGAQSKRINQKRVKHAEHTNKSLSRKVGRGEKCIKINYVWKFNKNSEIPCDACATQLEVNVKWTLPRRMRVSYELGLNHKKKMMKKKKVLHLQP